MMSKQMDIAQRDYAAAMEAGDMGRAAQIDQWIWQNRRIGPAYDNRTSHGFHLAMTLLTFGCWAPVWLAVAIVHAARR